MDALYEEFWNESVFDEEDVEGPSGLGRSGVPVAACLTRRAAALERITTLYHPFDLAEAGVDVRALLGVMRERDMMQLLEERGLELSVAPDECARLVSFDGGDDFFVARAKSRTRLPRCWQSFSDNSIRAGQNGIVHSVSSERLPGQEGAFRGELYEQQQCGEQA